MKYKVGDKFTIEMRTGFYLQNFIKRKIEITKIIGNLIWFKYELPSGGYREMFGYEKDLDGMIITE